MRKTIFTLVSLLVITSSMATIVPTTKTPDPEPTTLKAKLKESLTAWKKTPRKERKQRFKLAKKELKAYKEARKTGSEADTNTILLAILAIILPPLAVYLHQGSTNNKFWITLLLWILGILGWIFFSGWAMLAAIVYALIVVLGGA